MAQQQDYGAVQGLMDDVRKVEDFFTGKAQKKSPPEKPDTAWHDEMVRKANESFRKDQEKRGTTLKSSGNSSGETKRAGKRRPKQGRGK
jgi:hypothetical protein